MQTRSTAVLALTFLALSATPAMALDLTDRQIDVSGPVTVSAAQKIGERIVTLDMEAEAPIYLIISSTRGSAQGVMLVSDVIRSVKSPVVSVVVTQVMGAGAALPMFTDRTYIFPSAGLVLTEVEYEGVAKPAPPPKDPTPPAVPVKVDEPTPEAKLLLQVREQYLAAFWAAVAKNMNYKTDFLASKIAGGGLILSPAEAMKQKLAYEVVERLSFRPLPESKSEYKVTTTDRTTRTTKPLINDQGPKPIVPN